jgi:hypothetical protein
LTQECQEDTPPPQDVSQGKAAIYPKGDPQALSE